MCMRMFAVWCAGKGKPHGIRAARKLVMTRKKNRWADKDFNKAHSGSRWKANPFGGASHAKGTTPQTSPPSFFPAYHTAPTNCQFWFHISNPSYSLIPLISSHCICARVSI